MNWLLGIVIIVLAWSAIHGYRKGFLRTVLRIVEGIVMLVFVTWMTPYVSDFLVTYTPIETNIEEHCNQYLHEYVNNKIEEKETEGLNKTAATKAQLEAMGVMIPEAVISHVDDRVADTGDLANQAIENSGIYENLSQKLTNVAMKGISFVITLLITIIIFQVLSGMIGIIERIPIIGGMNRTLGMVAGLGIGFVYVWIAFSIIALTCTMSASSGLISYIQSSPFLLWIYENNLLLMLLMLYL